MKAKSSNHWTTREFPEQPFLKHFLAQESDGYSQGQEPFPALSEHLALFSSLKKIECKTRQTIHKEAKFSCCSVAQSCLALCNPMDCSTPGSSVLHYLPEFAQTHVHWVGDTYNLFVLCHSLLLPSMFPSIRGNELTLHTRWPMYWSFSFNTSPSNEYSGLISFRMDWLDLLAVLTCWHLTLVTL